MPIPRRLSSLLLGALVALTGVTPVVARAAPIPLGSEPVAGEVLATTAIVPGSVNRTSLKLRATYAVTASLAVDTGVLRVATTITARNDSGAGIDRVELNTIAARLGSITISSASVDGTPVTVTVSDQTLKVPLGGVLPAGASAVVKVSYRATLKNSLSGSNWMFTRYGGTISLYRWIPWVSLARPFDRPNHGDPFVTPTSPTVAVNLTLDKSLILASPHGGLSTSPSKTWSFSISNVRDVSMVLASDFTVSKRSVDGVSIRAYSRPGGVSGATMADLAVQALDREAARLGVAYPWGSYTVVETYGGYGLESPKLVWIPRTTLSGNLKYLVYHETAHQWFYGLVGNDQQREPFADEAAADLLARTVLGTLRSSRCDTDELDKAITGYSSDCYYEVIYIQGGKKLNTYREQMGTTLFWSTIRKYLTTYAHQLAGTKKLLDMLLDASAYDLLPNLKVRFPSLY